MDLEMSELIRELPNIWDTHQRVEINGVKRDLVIRTIPKEWNSRICQYMLENSYRTNVIYKHLKFHENPESEEIYLRMVRLILGYVCSFMAIDEEANEILGVALVKPITKQFRSWINSALQQRGKLCRFFKLEYENPKFPVDSLNLVEYYINDELKKDEVFLKKFFGAVREMARHMRMPRVTFIAARLEEQQTAEKIGFQVLSTVIYSFIKLKTGEFPYQSLHTINETSMVLYETFLEQLEEERDDGKSFDEKKNEAEEKKEEE